MKAWFKHYPKAFQSDECRALVEYVAKYPESAATVGYGGAGPGNVNEKIRRSTKRWLPRDDVELRFLFDRLILLVLDANHKTFFLDLDSYPYLSFANAQFATYRAENEGCFVWHEDNCWVRAPHTWTNKDRKLSVILLLDDPTTFEGGEFQLERINVPKLSQGDVIVFPSNFRHQVTPVTSGERNTITLWCHGPRLR